VRATEAGVPAVWIVDSKTSKVSRREVETGDVMGDSIEVVGGLNAGERIAVTATSLLRDGMVVEPLVDLGAL
jgi:multidrug efflux pump subunit AcrA (membrane-fusion protein)